MQTLQLTDGTTTVNLLDTAGLHLAAEGWAPAVAAPSQSDLGGSQYEDVSEAIAVEVQTTNGIAALRRVALLLEQARRWARGENVAAVRLQARADNTTLGAVVLEAAVLGPDGPPLEFSPGYHDLRVVGELGLVTIRLRRRGLWLNPTVESPSASSAAASQEQLTVTLASNHPTPCPISLTVTSTAGAASAVIGGYMLVSPSAAGIQTINAEAAGASGAYTTPATTNARNGSVLRYTAPDTAFARAGAITITPVNAADVYVCARTTTGGANYATLSIEALSEYSVAVRGSLQQISTNIPQAGEWAWYHVGRITASAGLNQIYLGVQASVTGLVVEIDSVVLHVDQGPATRAYYLGDRVPNASIALWLRHEPLSIAQPVVTNTPNATLWANPVGRGTFTANENGQLFGNTALEMDGGTVVATMLVCNNNSSGTAAPLVSNGAATAATYTLRARRYLAYATLE